MTQSERWRAVTGRDSRFDGAFVYAVRTTGIYCRPSCASRKPRRDNVDYFPLPESAEQAGYRACLRCRPAEAEPRDPQLEMVRRVCRYIDENAGGEGGGEGGPPTLAQMGRHVGISPHHLQRTFKRHLGISPRQYADARRLGRLKAGLRRGEGVAPALYDAGYGSPSRVYERAPGQLGMTPATYAKGGRGARIGYSVVGCALGRLLVAATATGVCAVYLGDHDGELGEELASEYPAAEIVRDEAGLGRWTALLVNYLAGAEPRLELPLDVRATAFQWRVWEELRRIPLGETRTYGEIAARLGKPKAQRAVGRACATNPVSVVVPCHRAVREDGGLGGYRWGLERKQALLERERADGGERKRAAG